MLKNLFTWHLILIFSVACDDSFGLRSDHKGYLETQHSVLPSEMPFVATFQDSLPVTEA